MLTCVLLHFCFCCSLISVLLTFPWLYLLTSVGLHQTGAMATLTESPVGVRTLTMQEVITCTKGSHFPPFPNSSPWNHFETYQILAKGSEWKENNTKNSWKLISGDHHSYSLPPQECHPALSIKTGKTLLVHPTNVIQRPLLSADYPCLCVPISLSVTLTEKIPLSKVSSSPETLSLCNLPSTQWFSSSELQKYSSVHLYTTFTDYASSSPSFPIC